MGGAKPAGMDDNPHILLLGGSSEARLLAQALTLRQIPYTLWLSEAPRGAAILPQVPRLCRFDTAQGMQQEIGQSGFTAIVDASHVFDARVTEQGCAAASALGLPYLRVARPAWDVFAQPSWHSARDDAAANAMIAAGARVFCATGWDSLPDYAGFRGEVLMLRQTRRHRRAAPYPFVELVFGDPPFDTAQETTLFSELKVDVLVCRNLGGEASRAKLDAATVLGLDVILIDRPAPPAGVAVVGDIETALEWVAAL